MTSPNQCVVCEVKPYTEERNGLLMRVCPDCGLFWRNEFDLDMVYYEEKDMCLEPKKLAARRRNVRDRAGMVARYASLEDVCDIGCGEGLFLEEARRRGATHVLGLEPGIEGAEYARSLGLTVLEESIDDLVRIAKENAPLKLHTLFHVIEHLPDPVGAVRRLKESLPEGGVVVIETPDFSNISFTGRKYRHKHIYPEHLFYWNPRAIRRLFEKEGFSITDARHRDFDRFNLEPVEALRRLGIRKYHVTDGPPVVRGSESLPIQVIAQNPLKTLVKKAASKVLSLLVILMGRGEYLWLIARTPARES